MIVQRSSEFTFVLDPYRPDLFCETDFIRWEKFHTWIEQSNVPVAVSAIYPLMNEYIHARQRYGGGGFCYKFWFCSAKDRQESLEKIKEIFNVVLDNRPHCVYEDPQ
jgi:hypothetical protein